MLPTTAPAPAPALALAPDVSGPALHRQLSHHSQPHKHSVRAFILPISILIGIVLASTTQTETAYYTTAVLGFDQPYFTFYLTHSTFSLIFPLHLLLLSLTSRISPWQYLDSIKYVVAKQLDVDLTTHPYTPVTWRDIAPLWCRKVGLLTALISVPALAWFVAMALSTPMDVTAIYASSSFAAYGFSMVFLHTPLSRITLASIAVAFVGVVVISLDGVGAAGDDATRRAIGDGIMMAGAIILGLYEVVYKLALPEEGAGDSHLSPVYSPVLSTPSAPSSPPLHHRPHRPHRSSSFDPPAISFDEAEPEDSAISYAEERLLPRLDRTTSSTALLHVPHKHLDYPPVPLPPALHANFLTSCIGVATLLTLWPPMILLHWTGYEVFRWPGQWKIWVGLEFVAWGGALYNAGLMALIGIWGPTISSVANLLTIGVVAIVDALWTGSLPDLQTVIGVTMICGGFGVMLWEGEGE